MYVKITPCHDLSHSPTLPSLFLRQCFCDSHKDVKYRTTDEVSQK